MEALSTAASIHIFHRSGHGDLRQTAGSIGSSKSTPRLRIADIRRSGTRHFAFPHLTRAHAQSLELGLVVLSLRTPLASDLLSPSEVATSRPLVLLSVGLQLVP